MTAKIYRPSKTAMQSGLAKTNEWMLDFEATSARSVDPLMGYTSSSDMKSQLRLKFNSQDEAISYCEKNGLAYQIIETNEPKRRPMAYTDNFQYTRVGMWTH
jgi:hypothetical protein